MKYEVNTNKSERIKNKNAYENTKIIKQKKNFLNIKSKKIVCEKFEKEFYNIVQEIIENQLIPDKIDSYTFTQLMICLGCARKVDMENDRTMEFKKIEEMWLYLQKIAHHPMHFINNNEIDFPD